MQTAKLEMQLGGLHGAASEDTETMGVQTALGDLTMPPATATATATLDDESLQGPLIRTGDVCLAW